MWFQLPIGCGWIQSPKLGVFFFFWWVILWCIQSLKLYLFIYFYGWCWLSWIGMSLTNVSKTLHPPNWENYWKHVGRSKNALKHKRTPSAPFPILKREKNWGLFYKLIKVMLLIKVVLPLLVSNQRFGSSLLYKLCSILKNKFIFSPYTILMHTTFVNLD